LWNNHAGLFYFCDMSGKAYKDTLLAIWVFKKLGWSFRRIARLNLPSSHHTVTDYYERACEMIESGDLPILAKSEKALKIIPLGGSKDIEYLEGRIHQNPCGGGRRAKPHIYDNEWNDVEER
jgi:hypothetical protein